MVTNAGFKNLYDTVTSDANGDVTCYLTNDRTTTGTALFNSIRWHDIRVSQPSNNVLTSIQSCFKSLSSDNKVLVYSLAKPNERILTLALYNPFAVAPAGISTLVKVEGT